MKIITIISCLLVSITLNAQMPSAKWLGDWQGDLFISTVGESMPMKIRMGLSIHEINDSTWQWKLWYHKDSTIDERDYLLRASDKDRVFIIDEGNSIELYLTQVGNGLYSSFDVSGSQLTIFYELENDVITFRTFAAGSDKNTGAGDEFIPPVVTRIVGNVQHCLLYRKPQVELDVPNELEMGLEDATSK